MSLKSKLQHAGSDPYEPERDRDDISPEEMEILEQDDTYQNLAELRWLADELEADLAAGEAVPAATKQAMFEAVAVFDAPLNAAVQTYVDRWLIAHRHTQRGAA